MKTLRSFFAIATVVLAGCYSRWSGYQPTSVSPAMVSPIGPMGGSYMVPPPPPPDVAFINGHGYPNEWRDSHLVRLKNSTRYYVRVRMDGMEMGMADQMVGMPFLPPYKEAHFFAPLDQTDLETGCEWHSFEFEGYLAPNFDRPVARDRQQKPFCARWSEQVVEINSLCFSDYC